MVTAIKTETLGTCTDPLMGGTGAMESNRGTAQREHPSPKVSREDESHLLVVCVYEAPYATPVQMS